MSDRHNKNASRSRGTHDHAPTDGHSPQRRRFLHLAATGAGFALSSSALLTACGGGSSGSATNEGRTAVLGVSATCGATTWKLTMGQSIVVGSVTVSNDVDNLYVTYAIDRANFPDCSFGTLHAWCGSDLANLPSNRQGIPVPGQFPHKYDASGSTSHTLTIPLTALAVVDTSTSCAQSVFVVTHAEVKRTQPGGTVEHETAFGGTVAGAGTRWWFYDSYAVCCELGTTAVESCETAFAKGGYVFTTDSASNPERLPSLGLSRNRWGWAINLTATGRTSYDIWAGAGLNDTSKGNKVGTLDIDWNGTNAVVTYAMVGSCKIKEAHLYAGDVEPATLAPGQYGNLASFEPKTSSHTFSVALADSNGSGGVWLIAHAVVCCQCCT